MKTHGKVLATGLAATMAMSSVFTGAAYANPAVMKTDDKQQQKPNIIFMLLDDTGARDLGCFGNDFAETPNIDRVASEGIKFNQFYTQPVCSPSRSCLMTGNNPVRTGVTNYLEDRNSTYLNPEEFKAMPKVLSEGGYHTALLGKWHLCGGYQNYPTSGLGSPKDHGFDEVMMSEQKYIGGGYYFYPYHHLPQVTDGKPGEYLVDHMNRTAVDFIEKNAGADEPFMLYFSHYATHTTLQAPNETVEYFQKKRKTTAGRQEQDRNPYLAAMHKHIDDGVGMIDQKLKELDIYDNTIFVIASDNGGDLSFTANGELRGGKSDLYEGGIRDPLIIRWPKNMNTGSESDYPVHMTDFYQTFAELAGIPKEQIPENSGTSIASLLTGDGDPKQRPLYWCFVRDTNLSPGYNLNYDTTFREGGAIRWGNYKYLESFAHDRRELYDLSKDPGEHNNIISEHPDVTRELTRKLHELIEKDTYGKTFNTGFENNEYYLWSNDGSFTKSNGVFKANGAASGAVELQMYLYYDAVTQMDITPSKTGRSGLMFRTAFANPNNPAFKGYAATINAATGKVELLNVSGKTSKVVASADMSFTPGTSYRIKAQTDSDLIKIYVNDELALECSDSAYLKGGVGLYSEASTAAYDNMSVEGIKGVRAVTDEQLSLVPEHETVLKVDGSYVWPDVAPTEENGETLYDADAFLAAIGADSDYSPLTKTTTAKFADMTISFTVGSDKADVNGKSVTLDAAPKVIAGRIHVPLSLLLDGFLLDYSKDGGVISCSSSLEKTVMYSDKSQIAYTGSWFTGGDAGDTMRSTKKGDSAVLNFEGAGIQLYIDRGNAAGIFKVYIDDESPVTLDVYNSSALQNTKVFDRQGLEAGKHTIKIENTGEKNKASSGTNVNIKRFVITKREKSESTAEQPEEILFGNKDRISYTGTWFSNGDTGDAMRSTAAGDTAEMAFTGTGVQLFLNYGPGAGLFKVYIDGVAGDTIDSYSAVSAQNILMYEKNDLDYGEHTIKIENAGKGPHSTASNINLRRFIILKNKDAEPEDASEFVFNSSSDVVYNGTWTAVPNLGNTHSGSNKRTNQSGASASLTFNGTGIRIYMGGGAGAGIFKVEIDGDTVSEEVDCYNATPVQSMKFEKLGLKNGSHTVKITCLGTKNASSSNTNINLDSFEVLRGDSQTHLITVAELKSIIAALGADSVHPLSDRPAVIAAYSAFTKLSDSDKSQLTAAERQKLQAAKDKLDELEKASGDISADILALPAPSEAKMADLQAAEKLQTAYDSLSGEQQMLVVGIKKLQAVKANIATLVAQTETAADAIGKLPDADKITRSDNEKLALARSLYDALSDEQKAAVTGYNRLTDAEAKYNELIPVAISDKAAIQSKTYGDRDFTLGISGASGSNTLSFSSDAPEIATVNQNGTISIKATGKAKISVAKAAFGSTPQSSDSVDITVAKKTLAVTASNCERLYGEENPEFTFTYSGFANGESKDVITGKPVVSCGANAQSAVGSYPITITGSDAKNYTLKFYGAVLTINKAPQEAIKIAEGDVSAPIGKKTVQLTTSGGSGSGKNSWVSRDHNLALVDSNGLVTLKGIGSTTIKVTKAADSNHSGTVSDTITLVITMSAPPVIKKGWILENGKYYYYSSGAKTANTLAAGSDGKTYCSDSNGARVQNRIYTVSSKTYAFDSSGAMFKGTKRVKSGSNYYYIKSNVVQKNLISGKYAYGASGAQYTGTKFVPVRKKSYYIKSGIIQKNKVITYKKRKYALDKKGVKLTGKKVVTVSSKRYYVGKTGIIAKKAWKKYKRKWYYAAPNGKLYTSTAKRIKGKKYKFNKKSVCINK